MCWKASDLRSNAMRTVSLSSWVTCAALSAPLSADTQNDEDEDLVWALSWALQRRSAETQQSVLPGDEIGVLFSSIISKLSCWLTGRFPLLQSRTPTHSWGNSSVTNTSSSKMGRESGSLMAMCCEQTDGNTERKSPVMSYLSCHELSLDFVWDHSHKWQYCCDLKHHKHTAYNW